MYFYRSLVILHTKKEPFKLEYHINWKHFEMNHTESFIPKTECKGTFPLSDILEQNK